MVGPLAFEVATYPPSFPGSDEETESPVQGPVDGGEGRRAGTSVDGGSGSSGGNGADGSADRGGHRDIGVDDAGKVSGGSGDTSGDGAERNVSEADGGAAVGGDGDVGASKPGSDGEVGANKPGSRDESDGDSDDGQNDEESDADEEDEGGRDVRRSKVTRDMLSDDEARRRWNSTRAVCDLPSYLERQLLTLFSVRPYTENNRLDSVPGCESQ